MSIQVEGLTKRFAGVAVVSRVSLEIARGEMFVLLGPSGSGKSTLLRMIAGLSEVDEGRVLLDGREVTHVSPSERGIGFVFQNYALFRNMTVADNVEFALRVRRKPAQERRRRREELLELVGLAGFGTRRPTQLSGGQQQRVALARALASEPAFLLLDEPFGALDARIRTELRQTLRRIQREIGVTAVFVTHDQEEAFELADRVGVMNFGRILEVGPPHELYLRPRSAFVATFIGLSNFLVGESTPRSVRLGEADLPLGTESAAHPAGQRAQVLLRPEDVELASERTQLRNTALGKGRVEERAFVGSLERLRVRLDAIPGVRQVAPSPTFGQASLLLEVTRPQPEALARPLKRSDEVWIGVRRAHLLPPAGIDITVPMAGPQASPGHDFARALAERLHGAVRYLDEIAHPEHGANGAAAEQAEAESFGLLAFDLNEEGDLLPEGAERLEVGHLLFVSRPCEVPSRILVCVAIGEPGKVDVRFAERLAWRLDAEVTLLTVLSERDEEVPEHVTRFLEASARVLSTRGVRTRTVVRRGAPAAEILEELSQGGHQFLVVGAPLASRSERLKLEDGVVGRILRSRPSAPVIVVRAPEP